MPTNTDSIAVNITETKCRQHESLVAVPVITTSLVLLIDPGSRGQSNAKQGMQPDSDTGVLMVKRLSTAF